MIFTRIASCARPDSGKLKWHFQFTPHDLFDYDATETAVLLDAVYKGEPRKLLVEANRNGFVYVLDRTNGKFLSATRFAEKLNWASGIDASGRPIRTEVHPSAEGTLVCPGFEGATNWYSPSYNPSTHLLYFLSIEDCATYFLKPQQFAEGQRTIRRELSIHRDREPGENSAGIRRRLRKIRLALSADRDQETLPAER